jgi:hypothetical protein
LSELDPDLRIQKALFDLLNDGKSPTLREIQQQAFGEDYLEDSLSQRNMTYQSVEKHRRIGIDLIGEWRAAPTYWDELKKAKRREIALNKSLDDPEYGQFYSDWKGGRLPRELDSDLNKGGMGELQLFSVLFKDQVKMKGREGNNVVLCIGAGEKARYVRGSLWAWYNRDRKLLFHALRAFQTRVKRTEALGSPYVDESKRLAYSTQAALMDGTAWRCPKCGMPNREEDSECNNCKSVKP